MQDRSAAAGADDQISRDLAPQFFKTIHAKIVLAAYSGIATLRKARASSTVGGFPPGRRSTQGASDEQVTATANPHFSPG
jgi:hypothetical protein